MSGVCQDVRCPATGRTRGKWVVPCGVAASYALFTVAVHLRLLDGLDVAVRHASRPDNVWGPVQIRAARVVKALRPTHLVLPALLVAFGLSVFRRSLRPAAVAALVGVPVVIVTLGTKWVMAHSDPGTTPVGHGSFPSGHAVSVIVVSGLVVLLVRPGTRWGWALPAFMGCGMGAALLLADIHPTTDVVGAGLLALAALTGATAAGLGRWAGTGQDARYRVEPEGAR
jgi:hypothetical protein